MSSQEIALTIVALPHHLEHKKINSHFIHFNISFIVLLSGSAVSDLIQNDRLFSHDVHMNIVLSCVKMLLFHQVY